MIIIQDKKLTDVHPKIRHGFFGRQGGVSKGLYDSLNCGSGSNDDPASVQHNRVLVANNLGVDPENLISVWQVHSADCMIINAPVGTGEARPKADGIVTDKAGIALGILTADCGPLLFVGTKLDGAPVIGAAHSGWGGSIKGIGEATIDKMVALGATLETIRAAIGPSIGAKSYEVSMGFEKPFLDRDPEDERFFREAQRDGHLMFDMAGYIANRLAQHGVRHVTITGQDTFALKDDFFSYRRTTHAKEPDYGRQISAIAICK